MRTSNDELIDFLTENKKIREPLVINAMRKVDRIDFVTENTQKFAYDDTPLPIGEDQVISQPYLVAYMAEQLKLSPDDVVLEIGTGSGYHAAVLSKLVAHVYTFEIIKSLADRGKENIAKTGIKNVTAIYGDGYNGLPEKAPFDAIIFTAAPREIPLPLKNQLKPGGRMIVPIGEPTQHLMLLEKMDEGIFKERKLIPVLFVPMTGEAEHLPEIKKRRA